MNAPVVDALCVFLPAVGALALLLAALIRGRRAKREEKELKEEIALFASGASEEQKGEGNHE